MKIKKKTHKNKKLEQKIKNAWNESISIPRPCFLCHSLTFSRGVFMPENNPQDYGSDDQTESAFIFTICNKCQSLPNTVKKYQIKRNLLATYKTKTAGLN